MANALIDPFTEGRCEESEMKESARNLGLRSSWTLDERQEHDLGIATAPSSKRLVQLLSVCSYHSISTRESEADRSTFDTPVFLLSA